MAPRDTTAAYNIGRLYRQREEWLELSGLGDPCAPAAPKLPAMATSVPVRLRPGCAATTEFCNGLHPGRIAMPLDALSTIVIAIGIQEPPVIHLRQPSQHEAATQAAGTEVVLVVARGPAQAIREALRHITGGTIEVPAQNTGSLVQRTFGPTIVLAVLASLQKRWHRNSRPANYPGMFDLAAFGVAVVAHIGFRGTKYRSYLIRSMTLPFD